MYPSLQLFRLSVAVLLSFPLCIGPWLRLNLRLLLYSVALHAGRPSGSAFLLRFLLDRTLTVQHAIEESAPLKLHRSFWGEYCSKYMTTFSILGILIHTKNLLLYARQIADLTLSCVYYIIFRSLLYKFIYQ